MNSVLVSSLVAIGLGLVGVIADAFMKKAGQGPAYVDMKWFVLGTLVYISTIFGWFFVMKTLKLSTIGVLYGVSSILFLVFAGVIFFGEHLNALEWMGIVLAVTSMLLLAKFA